MKYITVPYLAIFAFLMTSSSAAHALPYTAAMDGLQEVPPNASPGTGLTNVDIEGDVLTLSVFWEDLIGGEPTAAHIHCCTVPGTNATVAVGFPEFPPSTSGTYNRVFNLLDAGIYNPTFLNTAGGGTAQGAQLALIAGLNSGLAYSNIHNVTFPGGEIRGNLTVVPEPASAILLIGAAAIGLSSRRRAKAKKC